MLKKIINTISKIDLFLYQKFGSEKKLYFLENLKEAKIIFTSLKGVSKSDTVRFVGGCVRQALSGENIDDIDLATSLEPEEVKRKLIKQNIKVVDTGISHGTVTAYVGKKKFEITTLREDLITDGRHADVAFSKVWEKDASRRDLTINAIYASIEGEIFDPYNGVSDLKEGKIKFIGSPDERIKEDYLRILRYLRFFTKYSKTEHDQDTIQSIKKNIDGINKISNERILDELNKILLLKNLQKLFDDKELNRIILNIFPQFKFIERVKKIENLDKKIKDQYDKELLLAILIIDQTDNYEYFCYKYKTSNKIKNRFKNISKSFEKIKNENFFSKTNIKKIIYLTDKDHIKDLLLFSFALNKKITNTNIQILLKYINSYKIPKFPITGEDLKKYGYKTGVELGKKLKLLEEHWIENNFFIEKKKFKRFIK